MEKVRKWLGVFGVSLVCMFLSFCALTGADALTHDPFWFAQACRVFFVFSGIMGAIVFAGASLAAVAGVIVHTVAWLEDQ